MFRRVYASAPIPQRMYQCFNINTAKQANRLCPMLSVISRASIHITPSITPATMASDLVPSSNSLVEGLSFEMIEQFAIISTSANSCSIPILVLQHCTFCTGTRGTMAMSVEFNLFNRLL